MKALDTVACRGVVHELLPGSYWHLTHPTRGFLLHNAYLAEGICWSACAISRLPGLAGAVSQYQIAHADRDKENCWESVRIEVDQQLPSRLGTTYLFESQEDAFAVMERWFPGESERTLVEARIVNGARVHTADAALLDCQKERWEDNARMYWRGAKSQSPFHEVLVDGLVYFPGWQQPPFGLAQPR